MTTKLLAVDDSKTMRRVLEIAFSGDEFQLTIAGSAPDALAAVRANPPALALVDGHLGASSGYDLCREIKANSPSTRVLMLSSKQRPYDEGAGSAAGADGTFEKPFDSTKLIAKVAELLGGAPAAVAAAAPAVAPAPVAPAPAPPAAAAQPSVSARPPVVAAPTPSPAAVSASRAPAPVGQRPSLPQQRPLAPAPIASPAPPAAQVRSVAAAAPSPAPAANLALGAAGATLAAKLEGLGLSGAQLEGVLALSREVVEQVVWEVVPVLAETLIKEEIARLTAE